MAKHFVLNTGAKIPSVGLGTWQSNPGVVGNAVYAAVKVGLALKKLFEEGVVKREDLFITSKLWCDHHAPEDVPEALDETLNDLQLEYLDLYLIHWPFRTKKGSSIGNPESYLLPDIPSTWGAMEKLYDSGKTRAIGAYSPLGSPDSTFMNGNVLKEPIIISIAEKLGKTPAQVALRWNIQMGHSVLPKSVSEERIKQNIDVYDWCIPEDLLAKFSEIKQVRLLRGNFIVNPHSVYKTHEELWDGEI